MAKLEKLIKARVNHCIEQLLELRGKSDNPNEESQLRDCIAIMQDAQSRAYETLNDPAKWRRKPLSAKSATAPTLAPSASYSPPTPNPPAQPAYIPPRYPDGSYVHDRDDPESDGFIPFDHPWRFEQDHGQKPDDYRSELDKPKGHWASATELARSGGDDIKPNDAGGITF